MSNVYHQELLSELIKSAPKNPPDSYFNLAKYLGTTAKLYRLTSADHHRITRNFIKSHLTLTEKELVDLNDSLTKGESNEEHRFRGRLLRYLPKLRCRIPLAKFADWIGNSVGWEEIDSLCQSNFSPDEILDRWHEWQTFLHGLNQSSNISHRRASLVLLTNAVRHSPDPRLSEIAFFNIERLKLDKDILITKAISWLLRDLIKFHPDEVADYLEENLTSLPAIAIRETRNKLKSGRKSGK